MRQFLPILLSGIILFSFTSHQKEKDPPKIEKIKFGEIKIDGVTYDYDVVIENGVIRKRKKGPSKELKAKYGHTPLTQMEEIPWDCKTLVIGKGMSNRLPITEEFKAMAKEKGVELVILQTPEATKYFMKHYSDDMNAIFHITC